MEITTSSRSDHKSKKLQLVRTVYIAFYELSRDREIWFVNCEVRKIRCRYLFYLNKVVYKVVIIVYK